MAESPLNVTRHRREESTASVFSEVGLLLLQANGVSVATAKSSVTREESFIAVGMILEVERMRSCFDRQLCAAACTRVMTRRKLPPQIWPNLRR